MDERITKEIVFEKNITTYSKCFKSSEPNQNQKQRCDCLVGTCVGTFANMSVAIRHLKNSHAEISKSIDCLKKKSKRMHRFQYVPKQIQPKYGMR